jgi:glutamyl-tRNA reductase
VAQLFRVTAGLDSMIVGEAEVQGQVKRAYELALVEDATGPVLNRLFRGALAAGKRARTETAISAGALSVPQVAMELAQRTLGDLEERSVLVIGAGETAELTARALSAKGVDAIFIANRHHDRAISLAERFGGRAVRFEELPALLADADIVVSSTSSPHHVIEREALAEVMVERSERPLLLIDLAVPRDIHPACRDLPGVTVHDMDDLQALVERNLSGREAEARRAETILDAERARFEEWIAGQQVTPTVAALREHAAAIVERALAENAGRWESLSDADRERVQAMARAIASRILHEPTLRLKRSAGEDGVSAHVHALRELFGLDPASESLEAADAEVTELDSRRRARKNR